jgi:SAM-dependent methyltransferase
MKVFHHYNEDHNTTSAKEMIPYILNYIKPTSVIDVGCGKAQWLKVFLEHGIKSIMGVDGEHVSKDQLLVSADNFVAANFEDLDNVRKNFKNIKFDLVLNLEVAEHLTPEKAEPFIDFLTSLGDNILFSAAIPNQTGENHFNEQPHSYWQELFKKNGFVVLDIFRENFWNNEKVNWWYRQNMFLVVKSGSELAKAHKHYNGNLYIHPKLFDLYTSESAELKKRIMMKTSIKGSLKLLVKSILRG